jgi:hypothetical protein
MNKVIFLDIDGCLLRHHGGSSTSLIDQEPELLPGVKEKLDEWEVKGYQIIITTGRKESLRKFTEKQLLKFGITYEHLIMGLGRGERIVINDKKPDGTQTASYVNINRNEGIGIINI